MGDLVFLQLVAMLRRAEAIVSGLLLVHEEVVLKVPGLEVGITQAG
jgi:hypothetical protein